MKIPQKPISININPTITAHQKILAQKGLIGLGKTLTPTSKKITFIIIKIFACLSLIGAIPAFILINHHFKKLARKTIFEENLIIINSLFNNQFTPTPKILDALHEKRLMLPSEYIHIDDLETIKTAVEEMNMQDPSKKSLSAQTDPESGEAQNATEIRTVDEETVLADRLTEGEISPKVIPVNLSTIESAPKSEPDDLEKEGVIDASASTSDNDLDVEDSSSSSGRDVSDSDEGILLETESLPRQVENPIRELQNKLQKFLPSPNNDDNFSRNILVIGEKAGEIMNEKGWSIDKMAEKIIAVVIKCLDKNKDLNLLKAVRHVRKALDPTLKSRIIGFFGETEKQKRNKEILSWIESDS